MNHSLVGARIRRTQHVLSGLGLAAALCTPWLVPRRTYSRLLFLTKAWPRFRRVSFAIEIKT